jgi:outer membrane receptor protein involved in Fe transport
MPGNNERAADIDDEIVTLSEFSVTARSVQGYTASESETGSRVATKIIDLPYNVNVVTRDFILDFAADELEEQMAYTSSFAPSEVPGEYTVRGIPIAKQLRNGFTRLGMNDRINIARSEVIKGPAAAVYGATQPGGIINIITEKPRTKPYARFDFTMGDYDYYRAEVTVSGPLAPNSKEAKTFYLLSGSYSDRFYEQKYRNTEIKMAYLVLTHKFTDKTSLTFDAEYMRRNSQRGNMIPYQRGVQTINTTKDDGTPVTDTFSGYLALGMELFDFSWSGPDSFTNRDVSTFGLTFEHQFNKVFSLRVSGNYFNRHFYNFGATGNGYNPESRQTDARVSRYSATPEDIAGLQVDLLAHYWVRKMEFKTLLTFDFTDKNIPNSWERRLSSSLDAQYNVRYMNVDNPNYYLHPYSIDDYNRLQTYEKKFTDIYGTFLRQQVALWQGKFIALGGFRYDYVKFDFNRFVQSGATVNIQEKYATSSPTFQLGMNATMHRNVIFYANRSESFDPQTSLGNDGQRLDNEEGLGYETGFKVALFEERLRFTAGYFWIERRNVRTTESELIYNEGIGDYVTEDVTRTMGQVRSHGMDFDFNYQPTRELQFIGGVGYVDAVVKYAGNDRDAVGRPPRKTPHVTYGVAAKYSFNTGVLRGFSLSAGIKYIGDSFMVDPTTGGRDSNQNDYIDIGEHDGRRDIKSPEYTLVDVGMRYNWKPKGTRIWQQIQVNVKNLLDRKYITTSVYPGERCSFSITYSVRF